MKKLLAYLAGGLACLGAGAAFYIALSAAAPTRAVSDVIPAQAGIQKPLDTAIGFLDSRVRGNDKRGENDDRSDGNGAGDQSGPMFQGDVSGFLGADNSTNAPRNDTILFMGDIMLGRNVAVQMKKNSNDYPFAKIKDTVMAANYAIANLEGPLTKINNAPSNNMRFHFDPALTPVLAAAGFDAFSLANNHGLDQGAKGESDTQAKLTAARLAYFGDVSSDDGLVLNFVIDDRKFAVIGLHDVYRKIDAKAVGEQIASLKKDGDIVIVYPHWGDEYQHKHNARQAELAHAFVDAGADAVIGSHPHVIEGAEIYKGKPIFYSLGNLVFDQYFSADTQQGLALRLNVDSTGLSSIDLLPYEIPLSQPAFADGDKKAKMLQDIASWSDPSLKDQIEAGKITL